MPASPAQGEGGQMPDLSAGTGKKCKDLLKSCSSAPDRKSSIFIAQFAFLFPSVERNLPKSRLKTLCILPVYLISASQGWL